MKKITTVSKNYIKSLIKICEKEKIDVVLPCAGSEILQISKNLDLFKSKKIFPAVSIYKRKTFMQYRIEFEPKLRIFKIKHLIRTVSPHL